VQDQQENLVQIKGKEIVKMLKEGKEKEMIEQENEENDKLNKQE
jgi:hypothetical protein